jgi:hypothetical protein
LDNDVGRYIASYSPLPAVSNATSNILSYQSGLIGFAGREAELQELKDFCASEAPVSSRAVTASGGTGKTRLAYELCLALNADGRDYHFTRRDFFNSDALQLRNWSYPRDLLLVVDYVATDAQAIGRWLETQSR